MNESECAEDIRRAQAVRLIDIFFIGPALIIIALVPKVPLWLRWTTAIIGIATIIYNAFFFFKYKHLYT